MDKYSNSNVRTLVFVDDDKITNLLVERFLRDTACHVVTFTDPDEAHEFLMVNGVDILVVDLRMPKLDGIEFLQNLQLQHPPVNIRRVIVQTGAEPEPFVRETVESMGCELILKDEMLAHREVLQSLLN